MVEPFFRVLVDLGYDRSIPPGEPTPARLIPPLDPVTVAADLVNAVGEGFNNALALIGLPPLLSIPARHAAADTGHQRREPGQQDVSGPPRDDTEGSRSPEPTRADDRVQQVTGTDRAHTGAAGHPNRSSPPRGSRSLGAGEPHGASGQPVRHRGREAGPIGTRCRATRARSARGVRPPDQRTALRRYSAPIEQTPVAAMWPRASTSSPESPSSRPNPAGAQRRLTVNTRQAHSQDTPPQNPATLTLERFSGRRV